MCGRLVYFHFDFFFFFFQAEDGIRDLTVTGVQTCALPIYNGGYVTVAGYIQGIVKFPTAGLFFSQISNAKLAVNPYGLPLGTLTVDVYEIGRASCRERV